MLGPRLFIEDNRISGPRNSDEKIGVTSWYHSSIHSFFHSIEISIEDIDSISHNFWFFLATVIA